ncbi:MAG: CpaF family protein [Acidimicrobiales bacterium]
MNAGSTTFVARLRSEVADDLAASESHRLAEVDRRELARSLALTRLQHHAAERATAGLEPLDPNDEQRAAQAVLDALFGLGGLQPLIDDERVENIDVNGPEEVWVTYFDGVKERCQPVAGSDEELVEILRSAAARFGLSERRFDTAQPELDLRLPDGSRLSALMAVTRHPAVSIRRHRLRDLGLSDLVGVGTLDEGIASLLAAAVRARKNIVVAGAMNSGKTTLVRALASAIPPRERVVTIEQAFELALDAMPDRHPDLVALEAREANSEGQGELSMARLVRRALRMNADRVIVGEVLGGEVLAFLNAMSQGRSGSMCTIHADSSAGVFRRIASYALQAPERLPVEATNLLIAGSVHFVVFIDVTTEGGRGQAGLANTANPAGRAVAGRWVDQDGALRFDALKRRRVVSSVREVVDADGMQVISNEVFRPGPARRAVPGAPLRTSTLDELVANGFDPSLLSWEGPW